jgi:hypothetical protein
VQFEAAIRSFSYVPLLFEIKIGPPNCVSVQADQLRCFADRGEVAFSLDFAALNKLSYAFPRLISLQNGFFELQVFRLHGLRIS